VKLYLIYKAMNFRRSHEELFREGSYTPVYAAGHAAANVCAFARRNGENWALAAAPRLITKLAPPGKLPLSEVWEESALALPEEAPRRWQNMLTSEKINIPAGAKKALRLASVFQHFPVALLASEATAKERSPT
jgi:(1->4)-alpha-D-glucan 1-alpha-D-glucosylmutase